MIQKQQHGNSVADSLISEQFTTKIETCLKSRIVCLPLLLYVATFYDK